MSESIRNRKHDERIFSSKDANQAVEPGRVQSHKGFLSNLFGLNKPHQVTTQRQIRHGHSHNVSQKPVSALQAISVSNPFHGIKLTNNKLFLLLLVCLALWLCVVYNVRHHEQASKQSVAPAVHHSPDYSADIGIIDRTRIAIPVRTTPSIGQIYTPQTPANSTAQTAISHDAVTKAPAIPNTQSVQPASTVSNTGIGVNPGVATTNSQMTSPEVGAYNVPVTTPEGLRVKTVVNR